MSFAEASAKAIEARVKATLEHHGDDALVEWAEKTLALYVYESWRVGSYNMSIEQIEEALRSNGFEVVYVTVRKREGQV